MAHHSFCQLYAVLYIIEFQKRGLVWLVGNKSEFSASNVDDIICAEIPDINVDPLGYALVDEFMMHGPCCVYNKRCPCMKDNNDGALTNEDGDDSPITLDDGASTYRKLPLAFEEGQWEANDQ